MANQFPQPAFGGQFPPPPFYQPYQTNAQQPQGPPPLPYQHQGVQQHIPFSAPVANLKRFEANTHVPSPPPPLLPPKWDPEVLKRLASSNNLQFPFPPPPPPPPPPQFFSGPFAPAPNTPTASAIAQQPFQHFPQAPLTPHPPIPSAPSELENEYNPNDIGIPGLTPREIQSSFSHRNRLMTQSQYNDSIIPGLNGPDPGQSVSEQPEIHRQRSPGVVKNATRNGMIPEAGTRPTIEQPVPSKSYQELLEQAKSAITQCQSIGATYHDFLEGGISQDVVDKLFLQLKLEIPLPVVQPQAQIAPQDERTTNGTTTLQPAALQPEAANPAMERKDRIAQLLAARKGHPTGSAKSSQSASPAPTEPVEPAKVTKTRVEPGELVQATKVAVRPVWNKVEKVFETPADSEASDSAREPDKAIEASPHDQEHQKDDLGSLHATTTDQNALSTPVREEMIQRGFSIPGLFMTAAESAGLEASREATAPLTIIKKPKAVESSTMPKSLKRGADALLSDDAPQAKRQASHALSKLDGPDATVPEVVQTASVELLRQRELLEQNTIPSKVNNNNAPVTKPKVNTDKLKARMAALKAETERKNARVKMLQDGMPMLDAEVTRTRERLQMQQDRLGEVRKNIADQVIELDRVRDEENRLMQEIDRLQNQLADGEQGQQQFSNELNSLSDQATTDVPLSSPTPVTNNMPPIEDQQGNDEAENNLSPSASLNTSTTLPGLTMHEDQKERTKGETPEARRSETEYSPEQEDLDRQLNSEVVITLDRVQDEVPDQQVISDVDDQHSTQPYPGNVVQNESQLSTTATPSEDGAIGDDEGEEDDRMSIDEISNADTDGSASMSDSGSEDYEPKTHVNVPRQEGSEEGEEYEPAEATPYQQLTEAENDEYEPADHMQHPRATTIEPEAVFSPLVSAAPTEVSTAVRPSPAAEALEAPQDGQETPLEAEPVLPADRDKGLTRNQEAVSAEPLVLEPLADASKPAVQLYVPYQSPLAILKSFRFNPQFDDVVKGGYRSLTYSNNIDSKKPICATELQGEQCSADNCGKDYQHFGSMTLSDDKILVQMSSANDIADKEQKDTYLLGLKKVIAGLRQNGVKEFSEVARALSKYRREWSLLQNNMIA